MSWGDPEQVEGLLGREFTLRFENGISNAYYDDVNALWSTFLRGFGPLRRVYDSLDEADRRAFKADVDAYHQHFAVPAGVHVRREYLLTIGTRR